MIDAEERDAIVAEVDEGIAKRVRAAATMNPGNRVNSIAASVARYLASYVAQREDVRSPDVTVVVKEEGRGLYMVGFKIEIPSRGGDGWEHD